MHLATREPGSRSRPADAARAAFQARRVGPMRPRTLPDRPCRCDKKTRAGSSVPRTRPARVRAVFRFVRDLRCLEPPLRRLRAARFPARPVEPRATTRASRSPRLERGWIPAPGHLRVPRAHPPAGVPSDLAAVRLPSWTKPRWRSLRRTRGNAAQRVRRLHAPGERPWWVALVGGSGRRLWWAALVRSHAVESCRRALPNHVCAVEHERRAVGIQSGQPPQGSAAARICRRERSAAGRTAQGATVSRIVRSRGRSSLSRGPRRGLSRGPRRGQGKWSGREDLNLRPLRPERNALAKLSYAPRIGRKKDRAGRGGSQIPLRIRA